MSSIIPFDFETNAVRVVMLDGAPWLVAADVCRVLGHSNPTVALSRLDDDEKQMIDPKLSLGSSVSGGGAQMMNVISESGLYALIVTSKIPTAKRFRKWVTAEVLPAIRRDGSYALPDIDREELEEKRAYWRALPEHQQALAQRRTEAVALVEELISGGMRVTTAIREAAGEFEMSERTLWSYRRAVYMVARPDREAALAPRWNGERGMLAEIHPEALKLFLDLSSRPGRFSDIFARVREEAAAQGWAPIPSDRTMRRFRGRLRRIEITKH